MTWPAVLGVGQRAIDLCLIQGWFADDQIARVGERTVVNVCRV